MGFCLFRCFSKKRDLQFLCIGAISILLLWIASWQTSLSFFGGGLINILPNLLLTKIFFKKRNTHEPKRFLKAFYWGETVKIITTALLFVAILQWPGVKGLPLLLGFIVAQMTYWVVLFLYAHHN